MNNYAILILTVWSCAEWGRVDGSSHPTSGPLLDSIRGHLPKYLIRPHLLHRLNNLLRQPLLGILKKVSLRFWIQYLQQVHLPKSQKQQRSVAHAKNMALWVDMVTNQSMVISLKMTITSLKIAITNLLSMD